jgi:predicted nucleic acid-binding protein
VLLLDTGVLLASLDRHEPLHDACRGLVESATEAVAVPSPALCELDHLLHQRIGPAAMAAFLSRVRSGELDVAATEPGDMDRVIELMERYEDLDVGYVDAAILAIVERLGEPKLATLDRKHFGAMRPRHVESLELLPG